MFSWQITPVFEVPLFIFIIYFMYVVTDKERKDISSKWRFSEVPGGADQLSSLFFTAMVIILIVLNDSAYVLLSN